MGVLHHHHLHHQSPLSSSSSPPPRNFTTTFAITLFLLFAASTSAISTSKLLGRETATTTRRQKEEIIEERESKSMEERTWDGGALKVNSERRRLIGPGSSPPTCRSKCGKCTPCKPVHVPIHPGVSLPLEYYPEAWRCKCGNKLFMP